MIHRAGWRLVTKGVWEYRKPDGYAYGRCVESAHGLWFAFPHAAPSSGKYYRLTAAMKALERAVRRLTYAP